MKTVAIIKSIDIYQTFKIRLYMAILSSQEIRKMEFTKWNPDHVDIGGILKDRYPDSLKDELLYQDAFLLMYKFYINSGRKTSSWYLNNYCKRFVLRLYKLDKWRLTEYDIQVAHGAHIISYLQFNDIETLLEFLSPIFDNLKVKNNYYTAITEMMTEIKKDLNKVATP